MDFGQMIRIGKRCASNFHVLYFTGQQKLAAAVSSRELC